MPAGDRAGAQEQTVGCEVRLAQVPFEGGQVVPAHAGVGQDAVAGVQAQAAARLHPGRGTGAGLGVKPCVLSRIIQASCGYSSRRGTSTPQTSPDQPPAR